MPKLGKDVNLWSQRNVTNQEQTAIKTEFLLGSLGLYNIMSSFPKTRGQTMTEYALILAAVAVVVFAAYQTMGSTIGKLLTNVDSQI